MPTPEPQDAESEEGYHFGDLKESFTRSIIALLCVNPESKPLDGEVWPWPVSGDSKGVTAYVTNPEACPVFRTLVFLKYGLTFRELVLEIDNNPRAYRKWIKVHEDFYRLRVGKRSFDDLRLKFNLAHFRTMQQGLAFGLKDLNQWELADCFDEICPCRSRNHSPEYLAKLRTRIVKALESLRHRNAKPTSF